MPNRILKDSICTSETIDGLSLEGERFFYRLMVQCDDFGRFDARPTVLRARCFPLRLDKVSDKHVAKWLDELVAANLIWTYSVDDHTYLQVTKWHMHQQIRTKRSRYPEPDAIPPGLISTDSNGNQVKSIDAQNPKESESEIESEIESESESNKRAPARVPPDLPGPVRVFLENGGKLPGGKLSDGTPKSARAAAYIAENVVDNPDSLKFWGQVVYHYQLTWSPKSYTVMVNEYYLRGRVPGQTSNGKTGPPSEPKGYAGIREYIRREGIGDD